MTVIDKLLESRFYSCVVSYPLSFGRRLFNGWTRTVDLVDRGSNPPAALSKPGQFRSSHVACVFRNRHKKPLVPSTWCQCQGK